MDLASLANGAGTSPRPWSMSMRLSAWPSALGTMTWPCGQCLVSAPSSDDAFAADDRSVTPSVASDDDDDDASVARPASCARSARSKARSNPRPSGIPPGFGRGLRALGRRGAEESPSASRHRGRLLPAPESGRRDNIIARRGELSCLLRNPRSPPARVTTSGDRRAAKQRHLRDEFHRQSVARALREDVPILSGRTASRPGLSSASQAAAAAEHGRIARPPRATRMAMARRPRRARRRGPAGHLSRGAGRQDRARALALRRRSAPAPTPEVPHPKPLEEIHLPPTEVHESARSNFRMRAEFRVWHDGDRSYLAMFDSDDPKTPIEVPSFPMGSEKINELAAGVHRRDRQVEVIRRKLFQVNFLTTMKGDALISMLYHKPVKTDEWELEAEKMRQRLGVSIIGRSRKQKVRDPIPPSARVLIASMPTPAGAPKTRKMNIHHRINPLSYGRGDRLHAPPTEEHPRAFGFFFWFLPKPRAGALLSRVHPLTPRLRPTSRSRSQVVLGNDYVMEEIEVDGRVLTYKQLEGGFTQPNAGISAKMLEWARSAAVSDSADAVGEAAAPRAGTTTSWSCTAATATSPLRWRPCFAPSWPRR